MDIFGFHTADFRNAIRTEERRITDSETRNEVEFATTATVSTYERRVNWVGVVSYALYIFFTVQRHTIMVCL